MGCDCEGHGLEGVETSDILQLVTIYRKAYEKTQSETTLSMLYALQQELHRREVEDV